MKNSSSDITGWEKIYEGKVRQIYAPTQGPQDQVLIVATDRLSVFDRVLDVEIPDKGKILTQLSVWWFTYFSDIPHHFISTDVPEEVAGRAMICKKLTMFPVECIVRGYLTGSALSQYQHLGTLNHFILPSGLLNGSSLPHPFFTPSTKAAQGDHDEHLSFEDMKQRIGQDYAEELRNLSLKIYSKAKKFTQERGVILADTKLEFGIDEAGILCIGDEILTPDSSRYWDAHTWKPGKEQSSFDKQYVRDWVKQAPKGVTDVPLEIIEKSHQRYLNAYEKITGEKFYS